MSHKSRLADLVLCLFFGVFGAHKFYEEKIGKGVLYLFTAGFWGVGVIIDLFIIISGNATDAYDDKIKNWTNNRFFNLYRKKRWYMYLLPLISLAIQSFLIFAVIKEGPVVFFDGGSIIWGIVRSLILLAISYSPFFAFIGNAEADGLSNYGVGDWLIMILHLPVFIIAIILILAGIGGKAVLKSSNSTSSDSKGNSDKTYSIDENDRDVLGNVRVRDEFGNVIDYASVDYSGQGDYKGSDGSTIYNKKN